MKKYIANNIICSFISRRLLCRLVFRAVKMSEYDFVKVCLHKTNKLKRKKNGKECLLVIILLTYIFILPLLHQSTKV